MSIGRIESVYRRDHKRLWRSLLAYTGDPDVASDAEAETFAQALKRGNELNDPAAWIWRSAFRIAGGMMSSSRTEQAMAVVPFEPVVLDSSVLELLSMLSELSDQQRAIVVLRYVGQFKPSEIAELLDTSAGSVRVQLHRSHEQLRKRMEVS